MPLLDEIGKLTAPLFGDQLSSFLHPEDAYQAALDALQKRFEETKGFLSPYREHGLEQYGTLQEGIRSLLNPETLMNRFLSGYQESPYTKQLIDEATRHGMEEASSMGLMGSTGALRSVQGGASRIGASAREQYLKNMMDSYLKGLGISGGIYGTGEEAAGALAGAGQKMGEQESGLAYGKQAAPGQMFQNLLNTGLSMFGGGKSGFLA